MTRTNKRYSKDLKKKVVKLYLDGTYTAKELCEMFDISDRKRISVWTKQYENGNVEFIDHRGKTSSGRPKKIKSVDEMTKDEYITHLELEVKILKNFAEMLDNDKN